MEGVHGPEQGPSTTVSPELAVGLQNQATPQSHVAVSTLPGSRRQDTGVAHARWAPSDP